MAKKNAEMVASGAVVDSPPPKTGQKLSMHERL